MTRLTAVLVLTAALLGPVAPGTAQPPERPQGHSDRQEAATGHGAPRVTRDEVTAGAPARLAPQFAQDPACALQIYEDAPEDASNAVGLTPYDELAPRLCAAAAAPGGRVTLEAGGTTILGREVPVVTVTAPDDDDSRPAILVNANIHGDELEGMDAALELIDHLATAEDDAPLVPAEGRTPEELAALPTVGDFLSAYRLVLIPSANPDGRYLGQRANANGLDLNRDHVTQSQPETLVMRDAILDSQPLLLGDHHGYVEFGGLIEPCTPPHGTGYEYDLFIGNALPLGLAMEAEVFRRPSVADNLEVTQADVPFRDYSEGWDDWPPIFTPQYAAYHGAAALTLEMPLWPHEPGISATELARRTTTNIAWQRATMDAMLLFGVEHREELVADQQELFRRGAAGEPSRNDEIPDGFVEGFGPEDRWATVFPRAYVIPLGDGQASDRSAHRLAQFLLDNAMAVGTAEDGSYVVDLHQPLRGLAHALLSHGQDISEAFDLMYDISGWSLGDLWGATVTPVDALPGAVTPIDSADIAGSVADGPAAAYTFALTSAAEIRALNALLSEGTPVHRAADGTVLVSPSARDRLVELAAAEGLVVEAVSDLPAERTALAPLRLGVSGDLAEEVLLRDLGFDVTFVSVDGLNADPAQLGGLDALFLTFPLDWAALTDAAQQALRGWVRGGGGVVAAGAAHLPFVDAGLLPAMGWVEPNVNANGVVAVTNRDDSPVMPGRAVEGASFGYPPSWFLASFPDFSVEQRYAAGDTVLLGGHWPTPESGLDGAQHTQAEAAGRALTLAGTMAGSAARVVLTGSAPLFRQHPEGLFRDVVDWLLWTVQGPPTTASLAPRLAGETRIETAVAISRTTFPDPVAEVVVTTAVDFPDALAAGPMGAPILLTPPDAVPPVVLTELARLDPDRIVVVGGEAAVGEAAVEDLITVAPVVRRAGPNRYATAAAVSRGQRPNPAARSSSRPARRSPTRWPAASSRASATPRSCCSRGSACPPRPSWSSHAWRRPRSSCSAASRPSPTRPSPGSTSSPA